MVYVDDDLFTRLSHVAIWNTRQTEFGKEMPYAGPDQLRRHDHRAAGRHDVAAA